MPITTLDPVTALVVIDLQAGILARPAVPHAGAAVVANAAQLAQAFRRRGLPVILVNVAGSSPSRAEVARPNIAALPASWTELAPELDRQVGDIVVTKYSVGAFYGTGLDMQLRRRAVTQIVLCGIATSNGVESTARDAHDRGYHLVFAVDAMADRSAELHAHSVEKIFPRIGETGTTAEVVAMLG